MANIRQPRHGSMQFWPRVRSKNEVPRVRHFASSEKPQLLGFAGYKAGMTQVALVDGYKHSPTKGMTIAQAVTIIEVPPMNFIGVRFYKKTFDGNQVIAQVMTAKLPVELGARIELPKQESKATIDSVDSQSYDDLRMLVATQPKMCGFAKKASDMFEIELGGDKAAQIEFAKANLGKTVAVTDIFQPGQLVDTHSVSKGKGFQGPVKRFGVGKRRHKSEKSIRNPASLGPWCGQGHVMYRVAHAGKMGYHLRTEWNKKILLISDDVTKINPLGGLVRYGLVNTTYLLIAGSVTGPKKRLIKMTVATRPNKTLLGDAPTIENISLDPQN